MSWLPIAFLMGFLGSLHCAVMCGPLVLGLPLTHRNNWQNVLQILLYQLGRISVYTILGLIIGLLGSSLVLYTNQETFSITLGIIMVVFALLQLSGKYLSYFQNIQNFIIKPISKLMGKVFHLPFWGFFAGFLNGLIPCGMVYLALAAAASLPDFKDAGKFMAWFGLGTTPLMLFISLGGVYLKKYLRFNMQKVMPWFMLGLGLLLILRASHLGIPFLSPNLHHSYGDVNYCL
jgi:sulfite exporter TauE/SafE